MGLTCICTPSLLRTSGHGCCRVALPLDRTPCSSHTCHAPVLSGSWLLSTEDISPCHTVRSPHVGPPMRHKQTEKTKTDIASLYRTGTELKSSARRATSARTNRQTASKILERRALYTQAELETSTLQAQEGHCTVLDDVLCRKSGGYFEILSTSGAS